MTGSERFVEADWRYERIEGRATGCSSKQPTRWTVCCSTTWRKDLMPTRYRGGARSAPICSCPRRPRLAGISVFDLTRNFAGPYCSMLLADLGADVVKVESPLSGDDTRQWRPPQWNGQSATFLAGNRGKRSIAVDLDSDAGQDVVARLAAKSDVVISSFRPGSLEKRGLDDATLVPAIPP